ncbi:MAG: glycosyltransferase family 4 protein [Bacteroidaceae bacterium]|nr:glycosyltransferase family 4 protein [Bacteroidaceae bacterium]
MKILFLAYYFTPDLSAGSFRNSSLFQELKSQLSSSDYVHVITTIPNRYGSYSADCPQEERGDNYCINRLVVPKHSSGMIEQAKVFVSYYNGVRRLVRNEHYDMVYASSSRLFTAFLARQLAAKFHCPLYLDIRDIFVDTMKDIFKDKKWIQVPAVWMLGLVERYTFSHATHINLISGGFKGYFSKYPRPSYSEFPNGIDDIFIEAGQETSVPASKPYYITYAGNIGQGQGLEKIVPEAALRLGSDYVFRIIGDGGTRKLLESTLQAKQVNNVELYSPMAREELIQFYKESTFLFFHLNDLEAFKKVLPSKMFEYGAFDKPIIAGVAGFAADFVKTNIPNYILFSPTDVDDMVSQIQQYEIRFEKRTQFLENFSRASINKKMAESIRSVGNSKNN